MIRTLAFLSLILLALASAVGYLFLNRKIADGERYIAEGQNFITQESPSLATGKVELATGKQQLSDGKKEYERAHDNPFLVFADTLFNGGKGFEEGRKRIAEGEQQVARGENKVADGEKRLDKGNEALRSGMEKLRQGKLARDVCAIGAVTFTLLAIVLGYFWRRSLARSLWRNKAECERPMPDRNL